MSPAVKILTLALAALLVTACGANDDAEDLIARVNGDRLTVKDLELMIPDYDLLDSLQRSILVDNWIRETLLAQEAQRNLIHRDPGFNKRVETYRRRLLADRELETVLKASAKVSRAEIEAYYQENLASFKRISDEFYGFHAVVPSYDLARSLIRAINRDDLDARQELLGFHPQKTGLFKVENLMPEVSTFLARRNEPGVYGPLRTDLGYHVIEVRSWYDQGTVLTLEEVWEEIAARISINKQRLMEAELLDSLRSEATIILKTEQL